MKNALINRKIIKRIATALDDLNDRVIYVGGAVVSLYINDPAADDIRPTKDVDISLEIASLAELENLRQELIIKGFHQTAEDDVICRFRFDDIKVDVMGTKPMGWAPANEWFERGFLEREQIKIEGKQINILPLAYFLASKFSAYHNRGEKDPRTSHDFEDITYILDNQTELIDILSSSPENVKEYLFREFKAILTNRTLQEAILANLFYETQTQRFEKIISTLNEVLS